MGMSLVPKNNEFWQNWPYKSDTCAITPYVPASNAQGLPEELLVLVYAKAKRDNVLADVFPNMPDMNLVNFMAYMSKRVVVVGLEMPKAEVAAIGWLLDTYGDPGARRSNFGFIFFSEHWGKPIVREIAMMTLDFWFQNVDLLYATLLKSNFRAKRLADEMGFTTYGNVPQMYSINGEFRDGTFMQLTKEEFLAKRETPWAIPDQVTR
jgi:RimJ/RimL family protein N-acetyltransferase